MALSSDAKLRLESALCSPTAAAEVGKLIQATAAGMSIARGSQAITGSANIVTGLATVVAVIACLRTDPAIGTAAHVSAAPHATPGTITVKTWKPTSTTDTTLIAGTGTPTVDWVAIGT